MRERFYFICQSLTVTVLTFVLFQALQANHVPSEWLPAGDWLLDWSDEFTGEGTVEKWYPMLGYTPEEFANKSSKGLRWNGSTEASAQMYSARKGQHWLNGDGQLIIRASSSRSTSNENGPIVETAYLMTGFPQSWDESEPTKVKWSGKFVSPQEGALYISARVRTDQVVGHSTWFAFWLFSQTRAYNGNPIDGTEVDVIEIAKGAKSYLDHSFNVANHWAKTGGSESKQFNPLSDPTALSLVDVMDSDYHIYGLEWSTDWMKCYVDGQLYYTFTDNIPSDPIDMMLMLTMEFQLNAWDPQQGDGRNSGPFVSETEQSREMSRAVIDYVRVYRALSE
ncbi:family 16 glycosylhydrolase [Coraliomargarita sp. SDUM461004]|uniref:Family 16 glycosylhydrolase n=1 Tax=Thalassobacterium sedimentorum TaxID=3041258 RepID=A0ABU1AGG0_9BACT|nr:family 16 glycosylhydrolase [Coraliomargarita sp. SDUM461004]MDQ8193873.1 family 16 glycosylhydrolase [Coraliomargarita sp. SDUM461004]